MQVSHEHGYFMAGRRPSGKRLDVTRLLPDENPDLADRAVAWEDWWDHISASVMKYIGYVNRTSAEDSEIFADAMVTAYVEVECGRYEHRVDVPFTAYVKGIARNMIREAYRRDRRVVPLMDTLDSHDPVDDTEQQPDFERAVERTEEHQMLYRRLAELPPRRRQVLLMSSQGYDTPQIAAALGIREDLVRQEKRRGLQQLRSKYGIS